MNIGNFNTIFNKVMGELDSMSADDILALLKECENGPISMAFAHVAPDVLLEFQVHTAIKAHLDSAWKNVEFSDQGNWPCNAAANDGSYYLYATAA